MRKKRSVFIVLTLFLMVFCHYGCVGSPQLLTLRSFGAKGDGKTDDTEAFKRALESAQHGDVLLSGEKLTYLIAGKQSLSLLKIALKDLTIKFVVNTAPLAMNIFCNDVSINGLKLIGTRGQGIEEWKVFGEENGVVSIMPKYDDVILITALNTAAKINISGFEATNIHARSCLTIVTYGTVNIKKVRFANISNKTIHVYHTTDDGKTVSGSTYLNDAYATNVGILPNSIRLAGKLYYTSAGRYMPQESFNFIVSFGNYYASNVKVNNYGSTGLTADRNSSFEADSIDISNTSVNGYSNNPSSAIWLEACKKVYIKTAALSINARSPKDLGFDNSALHIFGNNSSVLIDNLIVTTLGIPCLNKGLRGSLAGKNEIVIKNLRVRGAYKGASVSFGALDSESNSSITITNFDLGSGKANFHGVKKVSIGSINGTSKSEVNFFIDKGAANEKITIAKTNIANFGLSNNIKKFFN